MNYTLKTGTRAVARVGSNCSCWTSVFLSGITRNPRFPNFSNSVRHQMNSKSNFSYQNSKTVDRLRRMDNIPKNYELIYRSAFPNYMIAIQAFNFLTFGAVTLTVIGNLIRTMIPSENPNETKLSTENETPEVPVTSAVYGEAEAVHQVQDKLRHYFGFSEKEKGGRAEADLPKPDFNEVLEGGLETYALFATMLVVFTVSFVRLQRRLPIRIYTSQTGHCVGVFYGHFIPGLRTRREFVAGTLTSLQNPRGILWNRAVYQDGNGQKLILMEHSFRYPSDFNNLMEDLEDKDEDGQKKGRNGGSKK